MTQNIPPIYQLKSVSFSHNENFSLNIPFFEISKGEALGIVGPNGCGKSTLLSLLSFLSSPQQGTITYAELAVTTKKLNMLRRKVTLLTQHPYLLKRSVFENIAYGLKVRGEKRGVEKKVFEILEQVGLPPKIFSKRNWYELSGGEAQRVALAARLILQPDVLILDEPVASVDKKSADLIRHAIQSIREKSSITIIATSHDLIWLSAITDRMIRMMDGEIVGSGIENIIAGPWENLENELWCRVLNGEERIYSVKPPHKMASAVLHPSDIIISREHPLKSSARNVLKGKISALTVFETGEGIKGEIEVGGLNLVCSLTHKSVSELQLFPGEMVWLVFKASALKWA